MSGERYARGLQQGFDDLDRRQRFLPHHRALHYHWGLRAGFIRSPVAVWWFA